MRELVAASVTAGLLAMGLLAAPAGATPAARAAKVNHGAAPCTKVPNVQGKRPGRLLKANKLNVPEKLLAGADVYRILYTSAGLNENNVEAVCGLVAIPSKKRQRTNEVVAWAHGTIGMHQSCQPSNDPNTTFLGPMSGGIGAIAYGTGKNAVDGEAKFGVLQTLINQGRMVAATDYYAGLGQPANAQQHYALGVPAGAAVLDSARAATQLAKRLGSAYKTWKLATWGHSQGGHAALWAAQIAKDYLSATKSARDPSFAPVGVAAVAPATSFVATATTPPDLIGRHLGDLEMHMPASTAGGQGVGAVGPLLFSLVTSAWAQYPASGTLSNTARFPGYPTSVPAPRLDQVLTAEGMQTATAITAGCLTAESLARVIKYGNPAQNAFFVQPVWGRPTGPGGTWQGQLDATCLDPASDPALTSWCTWLAYNQPGPDGINPFTKLPSGDVLIAQGMADNTVYCQHAGRSVPLGADCLSRQYYDSLAAMCSTASVTLDLFAQTRKSPATHFGAPGQIADNGKGRFKGSALYKFFNGAFSNGLGTGCTATVR